MVSSDVWDDETAALYDEEARAMFAPEVVEPAVDFLYQLTGPRPALEFAIGTGRIALPLMRAGVRVDGIEQSREFAAQEPVKSLIRAEEFPGPSVATRQDTIEYSHRTGTGIYHAVGSAAMGPNDDDVVDRRTAAWRAAVERNGGIHPDAAPVTDRVLAAAMQRGEADWWEQPIFDLLPLLQKDPERRPASAK